MNILFLIAQYYLTKIKQFSDSSDNISLQKNENYKFNIKNFKTSSDNKSLSVKEKFNFFDCISAEFENIQQDKKIYKQDNYLKERVCYIMQPDYDNINNQDIALQDPTCYIKNKKQLSKKKNKNIYRNKNKKNNFENNQDKGVIFNFFYFIMNFLLVLLNKFFRFSKLICLRTLNNSLLYIVELINLIKQNLKSFN